VVSGRLFLFVKVSSLLIYLGFVQWATAGIIITFSMITWLLLADARDVCVVHQKFLGDAILPTGLGDLVPLRINK
jgi:hypothetical protein